MATTIQTLKLGEILARQGILDERQVQHILAVQKTVNRPFGDLAERLYGIKAQAVEDAWVDQYLTLAEKIDLGEIEPDAACQKLVNRRQAWQFHIAPLYRDGDHLAVATTADSLVRAVNFATRRFGEPTYFVIAEKAQLDAHLMQHYPVPAFLADFSKTF